MGFPDLSVFRDMTVLTARFYEVPPVGPPIGPRVGRYRAELMLECAHTVTVDYRYTTSDTGASRGRARASAAALSRETSFRCPACPP